MMRQEGSIPKRGSQKTILDQMDGLEIRNSSAFHRDDWGIGLGIGSGIEQRAIGVLGAITDFVWTTVFQFTNYHLIIH